MKYTRTTPCARCPFRTDIKPYIRVDRCSEILNSDAFFPCHETTTVVEGDDGFEEVDMSHRAKKKWVHCAGFLIVLEHEQKPNQMMRIAERLRMYAPESLDMKAPVYKSIAEAIRRHAIASP